MSRKMLWLLVLLAAVGIATAQTKTPGELLQDGIFAEEIEGDLDKALGLYDQVIQAEPKSPPYAAQAMYRKGMCYLKQQQEGLARTTLQSLVNQYQEQTTVIAKAEILLADLMIVDPASIMPADTLVYWESGSPGRQIQYLLDMLQGTPLENPLALMQRGMGPQAGMIGALFNPDMMTEIQKIRGMAVGISGIPQDGPPPMVVVMYPGKSDALRALIRMGLQAAAGGNPSGSIGEFTTLSIEDAVDVAFNDEVFIIAHPKKQLEWAVKQYTGKSQEKSLADNQRFFTQVSKKDRQENALTLWADVDHIFGKVTEMIGDEWMPEELVAAQTFLDPANLDELMGTLALQSDGVKLNVKLNLKDEAKCLAYNLIHTPAITQQGFQAVPSDTVALVSLCLSDADSQQGQMLSQKFNQVTGLDIGRELFANIEQINLFLLPKGSTPVETWPGTPEIALRLGVSITSRNPDKTGALLSELLGLAHTMLGAPAQTGEIQRFAIGQTNNEYQYCYMKKAGKSTVLSLNPDVIEQATVAVKQGGSVATGGTLSSTINTLPSTTSKLVLLNPGGILPLIIPEIDDLPEEPLMQLAEIFKPTVLKVALDEAPQQLALSAEISAIPPLGQVVGPIWKIQKTMEQEQVEARKAVAEKQAVRRQAQIPVSLQLIDSGPQVDGQIDPVWQQAKTYTLKNTIYDEIDGPEDLSANFKMLGDEKALYMLVEVTDDRLIQDSEKFYYDDSIEIFLNTDTPLKYIIHGTKAGAECKETRQARMENVRYSITEVENGYRAEFSWPWSTLRITPSAEQSFPLDVHINDDDDGDGRDTKLMWRDTADKAGNHTEYMGRIQFAGMVGQWSFDDQGGVLSINNADDALVTQEKTYLPIWSMALKVKGSDAPANARPACPMTRETNYQINWDHEMSNFRGAAGVCVNNQWYAASFGELQAETWYTLVATYDGEDLKAYKDGELISDNNQPSGSADNHDSSLIFGKNFDYDAVFKGSIDEARLYNYALNADEVQKLVDSLSR